MDVFNIFADDIESCDSDSSSETPIEPAVYVFGYGSLIWCPNFTFSECLTGCNEILLLLKSIQ